MKIGHNFSQMKLNDTMPETNKNRKQSPQKLVKKIKGVFSCTRNPGEQNSQQLGFNTSSNTEPTSIEHKIVFTDQPLQAPDLHASMREHISKKKN